MNPQTERLSRAFDEQVEAALVVLREEDGPLTPMEVSRRAGLHISKRYDTGEPVPWLAYAVLYHLHHKGIVATPKKGRYELLAADGHARL